MIRRLVRVECDECSRIGPLAESEHGAVGRARQAGWLVRKVHYVGIEAHLCPRCKEVCADRPEYQEVES